MTEASREAGRNQPERPGEVAITPAMLGRVLAEACDRETLQALKNRDWRHPVFARETFEG
ncbi:MAG: hypothetical protein HXM42_04130 [Lautropia mirabilis]|nr:hypothetical protein [Lautropia mirabilis]